MTEMIEMKVAELDGTALDWAVAVVVHGKVYVYPDGGLCPPEDSVQMNDDDGSLWVSSGGFHPKDSWSPSTDWSQGGPLLDWHCKGFGLVQDGRESRWRAFAYSRESDIQRLAGGESILIAACRSIVLLHKGEAISVPRELVS